MHAIFDGVKIDWKCFDKVNRLAGKIDAKGILRKSKYDIAWVLFDPIIMFPLLDYKKLLYRHLNYILFWRFQHRQNEWQLYYKVRHSSKKIKILELFICFTSETYLDDYRIYTDEACSIKKHPILRASMSILNFKMKKITK